MLVRVLILWGVIAVALALSLVLHRTSGGEEDELPDYRVVLAFVGSAYGLLLGLLVVFAIGHYSDARHRAQDEATSLVALHDTVAVYPPAIKDRYRHDLICYMRSIVTDEWPTMERGARTEAPRTGAFGDRVREATRELPVANDRERSAYGRAENLITDAGASRQQLLFFTEPEIPGPLWVVIYVGVFVLVLLIAVHYADHPRGRVVAFGSVSLLLTVIVAVLTMLDRPFGAGVRVQPNEMRHAITLLESGSDSAVLRPCPASPATVRRANR
jgi:hypothetical protein